MMEAMIAQLSGDIVFRSTGVVVIRSGGVGYKVHVSSDTFSELKSKKEVTLWTYLAVRENALDLYGFPTEEELSFFEMLVSIPGIGPKSGLAILSLADVPTLTSAVMHGDSSYLTRVSGIGKKNAEKIVLELKDKLGAAPYTGEDENLKGAADALEALAALGYSTKEAREALRKVPDKITSTGARLKEALKILGGGEN